MELPVHDLGRSFAGRLVLPTDKDYDQVRSAFNGMIDRRPALVALCARGGLVGEQVELLKDHPDVAPHLVDVDAGLGDVDSGRAHYGTRSFGIG